MDDALRLRHRMIPYLHTMNWRASRTGLPLVEPMYWGSPDIDAAYHVPNEYMFGTELLAAPITEPMDKSSRRGKADVWLPQGDWFDFFTGRRYSASSPNGRRMTVWRPLDGIPVFAKAGGIVPMQPLSEGDSINSVDNPQHLEIIVFPGADGDFTLMEDSGHYSRQIPRRPPRSPIDGARTAPHPHSRYRQPRETFTLCRPGEHGISCSEALPTATYPYRPTAHPSIRIAGMMPKPSHCR